MAQPILILCTCPNEEEAVRLAESLVAEHLAACVNILPRMLSIYRWQGKVETAAEHLLVIKSTQQRFSNLESRIGQLHSYDTPEIIAVPIGEGSEKYLQWLNEQVQAAENLDI